MEQYEWVLTLKTFFFRLVSHSNLNTGYSELAQDFGPIVWLLRIEYHSPAIVPFAFVW